MSQNSGSTIVRLVQPGAGQTVVIPVDRASMRMALEFMPDPNAVQKDGQNLEFNFEDGGKIVLEGYYDHFKTKTLPVMVTESGDELPGEDFLASLREDLLTAAGPGAGAGAPGSGAGEYADDPGALIDGVSRLGSLGTIYWGYDSEEPIRPDNVGLDQPPTIGDISIIVTTEVGGAIYAGVFEDAKPFQHEGDYTDYLGQIHFNFDVGPNTSVTGLHLAGFPVGTEIYIGQPPVLYVTIESADQILDLTAEHIASGVFLRPPFDADFDMISITSTVDIVNDTSGLTATVPGPNFDIVVDAVADKPLMSGEAGFATPDVDGSVAVSESQNATQDMVDGWAVDTFDRASSAATTETADVRVSVDFHTVIRFGDYTDGSETHYALVEVPSVGTWTPTVAAPSGVTLATPPTITLYFDANGKCLGDVSVDGAVSSKEYFQFEVPNSLLQETGGIADLRINFASTDTNVTSDTRITLETGAMAIETPGDNELWDGNDKSYTFDRESASGTGESPNFVIDVVDSGLTVRVGWASEDNDNSQHVAGGYNPNYAGMQDPSDGRPGTVPGVDPNSTSASGAPIVIAISGGDASGSNAESMTSVKLFFDPAAGAILVNGMVLAPVTGADGRTYVELTQANGGINASGQATGSVFFRPGVANSDADVPMSYEVTVSASSGASLTYSGNTIVVIDAVADLPTGVDGSFADGVDSITVPGAEEVVIRESDPAAGPDAATGWETDEFTPVSDDASQNRTVTVRLNATFADVDGSEDHFILVQELPSGWTVVPASLAAAGLEATGRTIVGDDGNTYTVYKVANGSLSQFAADIILETDVLVTGVDQEFTIKTGAMAVERVDNPLEYDLVNNQAVVINNDPLTVSIDVINSTLEVKVGWAYEDNNDAKHLGLGSDGYTPNSLGGPRIDSTGEEADNSNLGAPIVISLGNAGVEGSAETITSVKLYYDPAAGEITINDVAITGSDVYTDAGGTYVLLTQGNGGIDVSGTGTGSVYFRPLENYSDEDTSVRYEVTVENGAGASVVYTGSATVVIDAVADLPTGVDGSFADGVDSITVPGAEEVVIGEKDPNAGPDAATGWETDEFTPVSDDASQNRTVTLYLKATFADVDGSEDHFILVQELPADWSVVPDSLTVAGLEDTGRTIVGEDGNTYVVYKVIDGSLSQVNATIIIETDVLVTGEDGKFTLKTGAMAVERVDGSLEYDLANNQAVEINDDPLTVSIDVINSGLEVKVGWASENNNDAKHLGLGSDGYTANNLGGVPISQVGSTGEGQGNTNLGAPIVISLDSANLAGSTEVITSVKLYYNPAAGEITINGAALPSQADEEGRTYVLLTETNGGIDSSGLSTGSVHFRPLDTSANYSDEDTSVHYEVTVENGAGASVIYTGSAAVAIDAVADIGVFGTDLKPNYNAVGDTAAEPGEIVGITGSITFPDTADGSEIHYIVADIPADWAVPGSPNLLTEDQVRDDFVKPASGGHDYYIDLAGGDTNLLVLEMPPVDAFTGGTYTSANGVTITLNVDQGVATYTYSAGGTEFATVTQDLTTGKAEFEFKVQAPDFDDKAEIAISGISVDQPGSLEYDYANNVAVVTADDPIVVECDAVTGYVTVSFNEFEDAMPYYFTKDGTKTQTNLGSNDTANAEIWIGGKKATSGEIEAYEDKGAPITIKVMDTDAGGNEVDGTDVVISLTLTSIPDPSQGTLHYTDIDGNVTEFSSADLGRMLPESGSVLNLDGFSFKPAPNFSGDVNFNFVYVLQSPKSGAMMESDDIHGEDFGGWDLHVESVADVAAGGDIGNIKEDGHLVMDQVGEGEADAEGWYTTQHGGDQSYTTEITIPLGFGDTDGSESGTLYIPKVDGVTFPGLETTTYNGQECWVISGKIDETDPTSPFVKDGAIVDSLTLTVVIDNQVDGAVNKPVVNAYIETRETGVDPHNETSNDVAVRELGEIKLPTFDSTLTVKVGWTYEGDADGNADGTKHGGGANTPGGLAGSLGGQWGAPVTVDFSAAHGETMPHGDIYFTYNASEGAFYWNGTVLTPSSVSADGTMATIRVSSNYLNGDVTFKPSSSYSDADIKLSYEIVVTDGTSTPDNPVTFKVKGETLVVMDAVADQALIKTDVKAAVGDNQEDGVILTVKTAFADNDTPTGSEGHYILVEAKIGWECPEAGAPVLIWTLNGQPVLPTGYDSATGKYSYPAEAVQKEFFKVDVTGKTPDADGNYTVTIKPKDGAKVTDLEDLVVGTMVEEENLSGDEYNFLNNVAYDTKTVDVQVVDSGLHAKEQAIHEDNLPNAHVGSPVTDSGLVLTLTIGKGTDGTKDGGEYLDSNGNIVITFTFEGTPAEAATMMDDGYFVIGGYRTDSSDIVDNGNGTFTLTVPADQTGFAGNRVITVEYHPAPDQDNDLSNVTVTVPVTNATGYTDTLTAEELYITVDAVADQPTDATGGVASIDGVDLVPGTDWEADWNSTVEINVSAQFKDFSDGSEKHYLLLEAKEGWTCEEAGVIKITLYYDAEGGLLGPDGTTGAYPPASYVSSKEFFAKEVPAISFDSSGNATTTFTVTTPENAAATNTADAAAIMGDGAVSLITGGLAVEGVVNIDGTTGTINVVAREIAGSGQGANEDSTYHNNIAFGEGSVTVDFNVINDGTGGTSGAYEDHQPNKHTGSDAERAGDGSIKITLNDPSGKDSIVENTATAKNVITFQYDDGKGGTPGTFTYDDNGVTKTITFGDANYTLETATDGSTYYQVIIPDEAITADGRGVELTYNPPAYDNTDLTNMEYVLNAKSGNSKAEGVVKGTIDTTDITGGESTLIVDAVADKPTMTDFTEASYTADGEYVPGSVDYGTKADQSGKPAEAAKPGDKVEVAVSVTFRDVLEGGEDHYIIIKNAGWATNGVSGVDGVPTVLSGDISSAIPGGHANGCTVLNVTDLIENAVASWNGSTSPFIVGALSGLTITLVKDANGVVTATVDTSIFVTVPSEASLKNALNNDEGSATIKLEVAGVAVDRDNTLEDGKSLTTVNDVAVDWQDTLVKVEVVGSDISFKIENGHIFENLTPNAHLDADDVAAWKQQLANYQDSANAENTPPSGHGIVFVRKDSGEVLTEYKLSNGTYVLRDSRGKDVSWNEVKVAEDNQYAIVKFSGLSDGETADITLTFSCPDGVSSVGKVYIIIDGNVVDSVDIVNGQVVLEDFCAANYGSQYNADSVIQFGVDPGDNYSHNDFTIGYNVTVTDNATGQSENWTKTGDESGLLVKVDAVAQRPEFAETDSFAHGGPNDGTPDADDYYPEVEPGQTIFITTTLVFQDVNVDVGANSSRHFVLVEATHDGMFLPEFVTLTWEGGSIRIPAGSLTTQAYGDGMYYRIDVTSALQGVPMDASGKHTVEVTFELKSYTSSMDAHIRVGAATHEVTDTVLKDAESTLDNNTAFIVSDEIPITFGGRPTFSIGQAENWVSESDMSTANTAGSWDQGGNFHAPTDGGVLLSLNLGADCSLTSLTVDMTTVTGGTLYYLDASGVHGDTTTYTAVPANGEIPADAKALVFVPEDNKLDTEDFIKAIKYEADVKNDLTGQSGTFEGSITILVDAVAQKPTVESVTNEDGTPLADISLKHLTNAANAGSADDNTRRTGTITIDGKFADTADGSELHYALIKVVANMTVVYDDGHGKDASDWPTCTETFLYKGDLYYKVPMLGDDSVDVQLVFLSHKLTAAGHESDTISFLVMTEEQVVNSGGNREQNYDNNIAISDAGPDLTVIHKWPGGDIIWIDPNYENNTPEAHEEEESDSMTFDKDGGYITFGNPDIAWFELTVDSQFGAIYVKEGGSLVPLIDNPTGIVTYTVPNDGKEYYFKPTPDYKNLDEFNYDDVDQNIYYTAYNDQNQIIGGGNGATFQAVIDAVAQLPVADEPAKDYGGGHMAVGDANNGGNEGQVVITIGSSEFKDSDGSETHYALLRKEPAYDIVSSDGGAIDTVYLPDEDGNLQAYWRIEIPTGQESVDVTINVRPDAFDANREYSVQTGLMSEEKNYGGIDADGNVDAEVRVDNNISYVWGDKVTVYYSPVETTVSINVADTWENDEKGTGGAITIMVALGADDVLSSLKLAVPAGVNGDVVMGDAETVVGGAGGTIDLAGLLGAGVLDAIFAKTATDYGINTNGMSEFEAAKALAGAMSDEINGKLAELGLRFRASGYGDTDLPEFVVTAEVSDSKSGDAATRSDGDGAVVDAVAHAPDFDDNDVKTIGENEGATAAEIGQKLTAVVELTFADIGSGEEHYAILGQHHEWPVEGVRYLQNGEWKTGTVETFFDASGKPYYALKITDGTGGTVNMFESGSDSIQVAFDVKVPSTETDLSQTVKIGGASVETNMGTPADKELDLLNNWTENVRDVVLSVGVVETTNATMAIGSGTQYEDTAAKLTFTLTGDTNDSIQSVTIADLKGGTIGIMDNDGVYVVKFSGTGSVTLDGATAQSGEYYYMPPQDKHGNITLDYQIKVQDNASGAIEEFGGNTSANFTAVADKPENVNTDGVVNYDPTNEQATEHEAAAPGGKVSFEVTATFGDYTDGSESHYILVQAVSGWTCNNPGVTQSGGYYRIPVTNGEIDNGNGTVTVTVNMTAPSDIILTKDTSVDFKVGALSVDAGEVTAQTLVDKSVSVVIGAVETKAGDITITAGAVEEGAKGEHGAKIEISLDKALEYHEEITGVQVINLKDGRIWDTKTGDYLTGPQLVLDVSGAKNGRYRYEAADENKSGNVILQFQVTVEDKASGATKTIGDSVTLFVTPVTDTADILSGNNGTVGVQTGHTATVAVTLSADFKDYTGTEEHFFLVKLPAGASLPGGTLVDSTMKLAAGFAADDTVYKITVTGAYNNNKVTLNLKLDSTYEPGAITYKAGSVEKAVTGKYDGGEYKFSLTPGTYTLNADGDAFNVAPTLSAPAGSVNIVRGDAGTSGNITMYDADGDDVSITGVKAGAGAGGFTVIPDGGSATVEGTYGYLTVEADGSYSYTLYDSTDIQYVGEVETFTVQGTDEYAGGAMSGIAQITITLTDENAKPQPESKIQYGTSGNVNAGEPVTTIGEYKTTDADDGDTVTITGFSLGGKDAESPDGGRTWVLKGEFGTMTMDPDGNYTYIRSVEGEYQAGSEETFTVHFTDGIASNSGALTIKVDPVNHAPEAEDKFVFYNNKSATDMMGKLDLSDTDKDTVRVSSVKVDDTEYAVTDATWNTGIVSSDFTLRISPDGLYFFTWNEDWDAGTEHSFTYTVTDDSMVGGTPLTNTGTLTFVKSDGEGAEGQGALGMLQGGESPFGVESLIGDQDDAQDEGRNEGEGEEFSIGALTIGYEVPGSEGETEEESVPQSTESEAVGALFAAEDNDAGAMLDPADVDDMLAWTNGDLTVSGTDTILDFSLGEDKLFFEQLFGGMEPANMQNALADKIDAGLLNVSVNADGSQVQVAMDGQVVDIHLTENLGSAVIEDINSNDSSAKAALLEMMITQVTG